MKRVELPFAEDELPFDIPRSSPAHPPVGDTRKPCEYCGALPDHPHTEDCPS